MCIYYCPCEEENWKGKTQETVRKTAGQQKNKQSHEENNNVTIMNLQSPKPKYLITFVNKEKLGILNQSSYTEGYCQSVK